MSSSVQNQGSLKSVDLKWSE